MLSDYPRISVITPSYNQGAYIEETIKSVLNQGYPNLEYIIIDGGSTDQTLDIIRKYEKQISYWVSEEDGGLYDGLQKGFARSTGEIMCWINSDDMHQRRSLFTTAEIFMTYPNVNWIMGRNTFYDEEGKSFVFDSDSFQERWSKWKMYVFDGQYIQQESVFWRRSLWDKAGGYIDTGLSLAGDADLWLRFFRHDHLYTSTLMLSGFRMRMSDQKSKDFQQEYITELKCLIRRELKIRKSGYFYLPWIWFIRCLAMLIPVVKWRMRLIGKVMQLPPKINYMPSKGYYFRKF